MAVSSGDATRFHLDGWTVGAAPQQNLTITLNTAGEALARNHRLNVSLTTWGQELPVTIVAPTNNVSIRVTPQRCQKPASEQSSQANHLEPELVQSHRR